MPGTYEELNAIARKAWRPSPQSEFIEELMAKAEAGLMAPHTIEGEPLKPLLAHVGPSGNFNEPVDVTESDILAITRYVVRSG
jgi:hypothetical protein